MPMGMGWLGWIVSFVLGFVIGGVFFLSMKLQVEYVLNRRGPEWLTPACVYARLVLVAAVLVLVALSMKDHGEKVPAAMLAGVAGAFLARALIGRAIRKESEREAEEKSDV